MKRKTFMTSPRRDPEVRNNIKAQMVQAQVLAGINRRNRPQPAKYKQVALLTKKGYTVQVRIKE